MTKKLAFVLTAAAVLLLVGNTGAFSSASAERGVDATVVEDEHAYMAIDKDDTVKLSGSDQYRHSYLTVSNQFAVPVSATVYVGSSSSNGLSVSLGLEDDGEWTGTLQPTSTSSQTQSSRDFTAQLTCTEVDDDRSRATLTYKVVFDGSGVYAKASPRSVEFDVRCPSLDVDVQDTHGTVNGSFTVLSLNSEPSDAPSVSVDSASTSSGSFSVSPQGSTVNAECKSPTSDETTSISVTGSVGTADFDRDVSVSVTCEEDTG